MQANQISEPGSFLFNFVKQLRPGLDMTRVTSPAFLLKPVSYLELQSYYLTPIYDVLAPDINSVSPDVCMLRLVKWFAFTWSVTATEKVHGFSSTKPYNPILGEQFHCCWAFRESAQTNVTEYHAEQVSHHPPICAMAMFNKQRRFIYTAQGTLNTRFRGNSIDAQVERTHNSVRFFQRGEHYTFTLPGLSARGLIFGDTRLEHTGSMNVDCQQTGYRATILFEKNNMIRGQIAHVPSNTVVYQIQGDLANVVYYQQVNASVPSAASGGAYDTAATSSQAANIGANYVLLDVKLERGRALPKIVRPVAEQNWNESRRVWHSVTFPLTQGDVDTAIRNKTAIEEEQRRRVDKSSYRPQLFVYDPGSDTYRYFIPDEQLFQ